MDSCTHKVRLQYWKNIISQCQNRPQGQTAKSWLKENGICEQTYYLWQRKIRQSAYELMNASERQVSVTHKEEISFAEIPVYFASDTGRPQPVEPGIVPVAVIKTLSCSIAISADIPEVLFSGILKEVSHA